MAANLQAIAATGTLPLREELLAKYGAGILELLKLPGMGPKTVALLWSAAQIASIGQFAEAIDAGRLTGLPRMEISRLKSCARALATIAAAQAASGSTWLRTPPASLRLTCLHFRVLTGYASRFSASSRETAGDLDLLVTGPACALDHTAPIVAYVAAYPVFRTSSPRAKTK